MASRTDQLDPIGILGIEGRNGSDSPFVVPKNQCLEAYNIDWFRASFGSKRGGAAAIAMLGSGGGRVFAGNILALGRYIPTSDPGSAELWAADSTGVIGRLIGGTTWGNKTSLFDTWPTLQQEINWVQISGKLFMAGKSSAGNRLHVFDSTQSVRIERAGLAAPTAAPAAPTLAAGAVTATRRYRVALTRQSSGVTVKRSNLSLATADVVMAGQQSTVTLPASVIGDNPTHWELYAAQDAAFVDYRLVTTTVIGTSTAIDNTATLGSTTAPADGANYPPPSCKYLTTDDGRLILAGAHESAAGDSVAPLDRRVWWTSQIDSSGVGDDERVSVTGAINSYADVEEPITGISPAVQIAAGEATSFQRNSFYVFSFDNHWKFVGTGVASQPYLKFRIAGGAGCIHHKSIVAACDINGNTALYWAAKRGIMRITDSGQEYVSEDVIDIWQTVNLDATIPCHAVHHADIHQIWFWIATGTNLYPNKRLIYDTRLGRMTDDSGIRYGWALHEGEQTRAYCSVMFSTTLGASMSRALKPYIGYSNNGGVEAIWRCDTTDQDDAGTPFQAYVDTRSYAPWGLGHKGGLKDEVLIVADSAEGVQIQLTIYKDEGASSYISTADLTDDSDSADADQVFRRFQGSGLSDSYTFRCRVGDAVAVAKRWSIDAIVVPVSYQGDS